MTRFTDHRYPSSCGRLTLYARDYGASGPPVLLMHGLTRNSADFEPLAVRLAEGFRLIVPDQRGRGLSQDDPDPANYRPDVYARDMIALLDGLGLERVAVIGTSMGGLVGMILAALEPARVSAIVLNDVGPELDPAGLARIAGYVGAGKPFADWAEAAAACEAINRDAFPDFAPSDWADFARRTCRQAHDGSIAFAYDPSIILGFKGDGPAATPDLWPLWAALSEKPVLVVRGTLSDLLSADTVQRMAQLHSGPFEAVEVPRRGHAPLLDEPEALAAIEPFLARHAG